MNRISAYAAGDKAFDAWMKRVDRYVECTVGLSVYDLPDCAFRTMYTAGDTPGEAASIALEDAGWESEED